MGVLRVILAVSVIFTHVGSIFGYQAVGGEIAVEFFYVISGFFISLILNEKYNMPGDIPTFYGNRALRIFGPYWIFAGIALLGSSLGYFYGFGGELSTLIDNMTRLGPSGIVYIVWANLAVFSQDFDVFLRLGEHGLSWTENFRDSDPPVYSMMLIPQAWSLSLELMFYTVAPWVVRRSPAVIGLIMTASLALRVLGAGAGLTSDPWSYRFFPFEFSMFLAGALSYALYAHVKQRPQRRWERIFGLSLVPMVLLYPIYQTADATFFSASKILLYVYLTVSLPLLYRATSSNTVDRRIGELSYPIYLSHLLASTVLRHLPQLADRPNLFTASVIVTSIGLSIMAVKLIDGPLDRFRQNRLADRHRMVPVRAPMASPAAAGAHPQ
jgi:peptidoglycan/LPS O-acetylase OafA/YrhL